MEKKKNILKVLLNEDIVKYIMIHVIIIISIIKAIINFFLKFLIKIMVNVVKDKNNIIIINLIILQQI